MAFLCFTVLLQPNSIKARQDSNSRYLLVELDGSPDKDPGSDVTTEELEIPELEEEPTNDFNPSLNDDDEDVAIPENDEPGARIRNLNGNVVTGKEGGYRSSN